MDFDIKVFRITDYLVAVKTLQEPGIKDTIFEDGIEPQIPDIIKQYWIGVSINDEYAGAYVFSALTRTMWQVHTYFRLEFRKTGLPAKAIYRVMEWVIKNLPNLNSLISIIPTCYPNVQMYDMLTGGTNIGMIKQSFLKNGQYHDQWINNRSMQDLKDFLASEGEDNG